MFAGEVAAKHGNPKQVRGKRGPLEAWSCSGRIDPIERSDFSGGENAAERVNDNETAGLRD